MKKLLLLIVCTLIGACSANKNDDQGPDLSSMVEGVYKINYIALNGVDGTNISNPSYNVLVNRKGYTEVDISEVINNTATNFSEVPLNDVGDNKLEFFKDNGSQTIRGYFLNGHMEYTLVNGSSSKVVKANR